MVTTDYKSFLTDCFIEQAVLPHQVLATKVETVCISDWGSYRYRSGAS